MAGSGLKAALLKIHLWVGMAAALFLWRFPANAR